MIHIIWLNSTNFIWLIQQFWKPEILAVIACHTGKLYVMIKKNNGKVQNFKQSTKTNSSTGESGETSSPPIGNAFMYTETSSNNQDNNVFVSFER